MNKSRMKKGLALVLTLVMVFATTASVFAADNGGTANYTIKFYDQEAGTSIVVDTSAESGITLNAGRNLYEEVNDTLGFYEPAWTSYPDYYDNTQTVFHLKSFVGYVEQNVDHQYNSDGSGWSKDWGWMYTVNGEQPSFPDNPNHGKMMNQYTIQDGDEIVLKYVYTETAWDSDGNTIYNIVHE
ncbi:MAG: hypothetical protein Q4E84_00390 [Clostridia bacterium]|nr:hypothetical protein [Clostridia bacterium]MDO5302344.1 hypothetical protein [Clostridia bacterium]